jgi:hypothetical protein
MAKRATVADIQAIVPDLKGDKSELFWSELRHWDGPDDIRVYARHFEDWWNEPGGGREQARPLAEEETMATRTRTGEEWTMDEDAYIEANWGYRTDREIGDALKRSEGAVTSRRATQRLLRAQTGEKGEGTRQWAQEEDETLTRLFDAGAADHEIAVTIGRTPGAVAQRRSSLGLRRSEQPEHLRVGCCWTPEEDLVLGWMFRKGLSDEAIGRHMDRTATAIKDRRQSVGLWRLPRH